ncbi:MAG: hypothetical protein ACREJB_15740 [Planctomycetaceae bacterium]
MSAETPPQAEKRSTDHYVPLGWPALLVGGACIVASLLGRLGVLPKADFPILGLGVALFVAGYIACFVVPPLHRRIDALEGRITALERQTGTGGDQATERLFEKPAGER